MVLVVTETQEMIVEVIVSKKCDCVVSITIVILAPQVGMQLEIMKWNSCDLCNTITRAIE